MLKILLELLSQLLSNRKDNKPGQVPSPSPEPAPKPEPEPKRKTINQAGLDLIKSFEGLYLTSYLCPAKVWTIGWGSTGPNIGPNMTWTKEQAEQRLKADLEVFERGVEAAITVPVTSNQFSAIVSLSYNVGINAVRKSTLLKLLNSKDYQGAADQFLKWNKVNGKELTGLTKRRNAEKELFLRP